MKTIPLFFSDDPDVLPEVSRLPLEAADDIGVISEAQNRHHAVSELKIFQPEFVSVDTGLSSLDEAAGSSPCAVKGNGNKIALTKRILRDKWTGLYFAPDSAWVNDWRKAMHIPNPTDILATCKPHELPRIEFILKPKGSEMSNTIMA